jgi:hypothetical protein
MSASADVTTDRTEQREWQDLLQTPGWVRLVAHARAEWDGPAFVAQVEQLADNPEDPVALSKLRQLLAAKRAVMRLVQTPEEQVAKLKRGTMPTFQDVAQSRRGRL